MITLRQLTYLESLSRHLHFGRAAQECAISQPALSVQIAELESNLGLRLFERSRRGVILTADGQEIVQRCRLVLAGVSDIDEYAKAQGGLTGAIRIGIIPTIAPYILPQMLEELATQFPAMQPIIRESRTDQLVEELRNGGVDLIIGALPLGNNEFSTRRLFEDEFVLALPPDWPIPKPGEDLNELVENENLLLLEEGHCLRDQTLSHCDRAGVRLGKIYGTSNPSTLIQMVSSGLGITLMPNLSLDVERRGSNVQIAYFEEPAPFRTVGMAWRKSSPSGEIYTRISNIISQSGPHETLV